MKNDASTTLSNRGNEKLKAGNRKQEIGDRK